MKVLQKIISLLLIIILSVVIIALTLVKTFSSTILNEAYVFNMLKKGDYYNNLYEEVKSNFEKYIGPSGLDESILENVFTIENIQEDTETILGNIYEGTELEVSTETIKKNLETKINNAIQEMDEDITPEVQANINKLIENMETEYINTISHTEYEQQINDALKKVNKLIKLATTATVIAIIVSIVLLLLVNIKDIYKGLSNIGIAGLTSGAFIVIANYIINGNIRIQNIKILNDSISTVLQNTITDVLSKITHIGWVMAIVGIIVIILANIFRTKNSEENSKR